MRASGGRIFWASFFLTLAVIGPLLGLFAFWGVQQNRRAVQTQQAQSGVPIQRPGSLSLLLAVADERPAFVLVRLDGAAPAFRLIVVPGESVVLDGQGHPITLAESYAAAGPARAGSLLAATLGIQLDRYLAATPAVWGQSFSGLEQARVNLSPLLDEAARRALGVAAVAQLDAGEAASLLQGTALTGPALGRLRTAVWQAFALQCQGSLAESVPQGLRRCSGDLLTDLTALDLEELGRVLAQLADASCSPQADLLPRRCSPSPRRRLRQTKRPEPCSGVSSGRQRTRPRGCCPTRPDACTRIAPAQKRARPAAHSGTPGRVFRSIRSFSRTDSTYAH